jgi:hypothetical protein
MAAKFLHDNFHFNTTPETIQYIFNYYAAGPLQGFVALANSSRLYQKEYVGTRDSLGPFLTALGAVSVWGAPFDVNERVFYNYKNKYESEFNKRGVRVTGSGSKKQKEIARFIETNMLAAGFTREDVRIYMLIREIDTQKNKNNQELREEVKDRRFGDMDDSYLKSRMKIPQDKNRELYQSFVSQVNKRNFF